MPKINEIIDSLNDENASDVKEQLLTEANALNENNRKLYQRAKKAEGFEYDKNAKEWTKKEVKPTKTPELNKTKQADEFDYGQKAYLVANGIKGKEEQAFTKAFMEESGKDLDNAIESQYFQTKLKAMREKQAVKDATPSNSKRSSSSGKDSVNYWIDRKEQAPTLEMRQKVVNARIARESNANTDSGPQVVGGNISGVDIM